MRYLLLVLSLSLPGCFSFKPKVPNLPPPVVAPSAENPDKPTRADFYADKSDESESKAAAAVLAAKGINSTSPESPARSVVDAELGVATAFLAKPSETDRLDAESRASKSLASGPSPETYRRLSALGDKLQKERDDAWSAYEREKATAAAALEAVKVAEAERRNFLFAALGAGLFALGVIVFALGQIIPGGRKVGGSLAAGGLLAVLVTLTVSSEWFAYIVGPPLVALGAAVAFAGWRFTLSKFGKGEKCVAKAKPRKG
jgi:hypothetical protein